MQKADMSSLGIAETLDSTLRSELSAHGLELHSLIPIPSRGDRQVRVRTLDEILESLDESCEEGEPGADSKYYIIRVSGSASSKPLSPAVQTAQKIKPSAGPGQEKPKEPAESPKNADGSWNVPFLTRNAQILTQAGEHTLARNIWSILARTGACTGKAHLGLGLGFEIEGRIEEARSHFQESMAFEPSLEAARGLAATSTRLEKHADSARILERATTLPGLDRESRIDLHWSASNAWYRSGKFELAEAAALTAIEARPSDPNLHSNLGAIRLKSGRVEDAAKSFRRAIEIDATHYRAHEGLAHCLIETGQKRLAHDHLARSLAANISNPRALQSLARMAMELGTYPVAARILTEYVDAQPVNAGLLYSLAGLHFLMGNSDDALDVAARALGLQPGHEGATELIRKIDRSRIDRGQKPRNDRVVGTHGMGAQKSAGNDMPGIGASGHAG